MDNRDRLIQEVARDLGVPQRRVLEVVSSQSALVRKAIQNKEATSVYLRGVGTFMSRPVRERIIAQRKADKIERKRKEVTTDVVEEPLRFD